ncbi:MAG: glycosyltransferase family 2 protein [Yoonia sp.]|nr:glycosyltransferase family 2 protein [Yoonia sp.]
MTSTVCVIVLVHRTVAYLDALFDCLQQQTRLPDEIVVIDDGGIVDVATAVAPWSDKLPIKLIHHETNKGITQGRRTALQAATSEFCFQLDSDDALDHDTIRLMMTAVEENGADFACCRVRAVLLSGELRKTPDLPNAVYCASGEDALSSIGSPDQDPNLRLWMLGAAGGKIFRRTIALQVADLMDTEHRVYGEDSVYTLMNFALSGTGVFLTPKLYHYTLRPTSTITFKMTSTQDKYLSDRRDAHDRLYRFVDSRDPKTTPWIIGISTWLARQEIEKYSLYFGGTACFENDFIDKLAQLPKEERPHFRNAAVLHREMQQRREIRKKFVRLRDKHNQQ